MTLQSRRQNSANFANNDAMLLLMRGGVARFLLDTLQT